MAAARVSTKGKKLRDFPEVAAELAPGQEEALSRRASHKDPLRWQCVKGHEWEAAPGNRIGQGQGCPYCCGNKVTPETSLAGLHPEIAAELVGGRSEDRASWPWEVLQVAV